MVTVLIVSFICLALFSFALYRWQRPSSNENANQALPPAPSFSGLFGAVETLADESHASMDAATRIRDEQRQSLLRRAREGDKDALPDAHACVDGALYEEVLHLLIAHAGGEEKRIFALASYVARSNGLRTSTELAGAFLTLWRQRPERRTTPQALHVAALASDAALYQQAVEAALQLWREGQLPGMSADELSLLIESEFWTLDAAARVSGAGFLLKRRIAGVRRELAASITRQS